MAPANLSLCPTRGGKSLDKRPFVRQLLAPSDKKSDKPTFVSVFLFHKKRRNRFFDKKTCDKTFFCPIVRLSPPVRNSLRLSGTDPRSSCLSICLTFYSTLLKLTIKLSYSPLSCRHFILLFYPYLTTLLFFLFIKLISARQTREHKSFS